VTPQSILRVSVNGRSEDVSQFKLAYEKEGLRWPIEAEGTSSNGYSFIRFRPPTATPYKEIGLMIILAQRARLMVAGPELTPPLCDPEDR
jgi:hypothetical protein